MTITVDTSALVAIVLGETDAEMYAAVLTHHAGDTNVSTATLLETAVVLTAKQGDTAAEELATLINLTSTQVVPFDITQQRVAIGAWRRFGKGRHSAGLNLGDCFSYALAKTTGGPLLYKGNDFSQTDIPAAT